MNNIDCAPSPDIFTQLLADYCDGQLTDPALLAQFAANLESSAERRQQFYEYFDLHAELRWLESASAVAPSPESGAWQPSVVERPKSKVWNAIRERVNSITSVSLIVSALTMTIILLLMALWIIPAVQPSPNVPHEIKFVARLVRMNNAVWNDESAFDSHRIQELIAGQRLDLRSGLAEVEFDDGARVVIEGPTELEILSTNSGRLRTGSLLSWVPVSAKGFTILSELVDVVDLGTEFSLTVDNALGGNAELAVFEGQVEAHAVNAPAEAPPIRLKAGQIARFATGVSGEIASFDSEGAKQRRARFTISAPLPEIAYHVPAGTVGNQASFSGSLGMDFDIRQPIRIVSLGAFDSGQDGFQRPITVRLYERTPEGGGKLLARGTFVGNDGYLIGGSRFRSLSNLSLFEGFNGVLPAGFQGTIVAENYGPGELNGNNASVQLRWTTAPSEAIEFVGSSRWGELSEFPTVLDNEGTPNQYAAGTFQFVAVHYVPKESTRAEQAD